MFGYLMEKEIAAIENVLKNARHPFTAIIGGSKVSSKLAVLENLLSKVDNLIICGGMGYTFIKAEGGHIGDSLHEDDLIPQAQEIMQKAQDLGVNVSLSVQTRITQEFSNDAPVKVVPSHAIPDGWEGMDCGPASIENWGRIILASKTILWNGPAGVFEMPNFAVGTEKIAGLVAKATSHGAYSLVGGGDSVAAVTKMGYADKVSYVSTGGGAMLEAIEGKVLPGIAAIQD
jgi:3-phosphoglycerate kinase